MTDFEDRDGFDRTVGCDALGRRTVTYVAKGNPREDALRNVANAIETAQRELGIIQVSLDELSHVLKAVEAEADTRAYRTSWATERDKDVERILRFIRTWDSCQ